MSYNTRSTSKSKSRIFNRTPVKDKPHESLTKSPQTPKRPRIFSQQKYTTLKKSRLKTEIEESDTSKQECVQFLSKMLNRVENKNALIKQLQKQNAILKRENQQLERQNLMTLKRVAACAGLQKLKQKNVEYRTKLLKAQALLYQLKTESKQPIKGLDELIRNLHI